MRTKTIAFVLAVVSLTACSLFAESPVQVIPEFVNFGQVKQGETAIARFELKNMGVQALTIQWMEFSEPGLVAQVNPDLAAGSSVEVLVNWNTSELSGDLEGQIILGLDDPEFPEVVLKVSGTVIE